MVTEREPASENNAYLERNKLVLSELRDKNISFVCQDIVGQSSWQVFYTAGVVDSSVLGKPIHIGIKRRSTEFRDSTGYLTKERFVNELAILSAISNGFPGLSESLPEFYGMLVNRQGIAVGIITEDFSEGGLHKVREGGFSPYKVRSLFVEGSVNDDYIQRSAFTVNGKTRLGDFWYFWRHEDEEENAKRVGVDRIRQRIADFTLEVDLEI